MVVEGLMKHPIATSSSEWGAELLLSRPPPADLVVVFAVLGDEATEDEDGSSLLGRAVMAEDEEVDEPPPPPLPLWLRLPGLRPPRGAGLAHPVTNMTTLVSK